MTYLDRNVSDIKQKMANAAAMAGRDPEEITLLAAVKSGEVDAVIALGCVVRGDTPHFDYVCAGTTQGIAELNAQGNIPVIFGLITTDTMQQAEDRAGGIHGNKGDECAVTAIKMVDLASRFG